MTIMSDEEKAALDAKEAAEKAKADADAQDDDQSDDDDDNASNGDDDTTDDKESAQLKADLESEKSARIKAEKALAKKAFDKRKGKRETAKDDDATDVEEDDDDADEDKPLTRKQMDAALARERENTRRETLANEAGRLAQSMSTNATMQELILEKWKNRSFPADLSLQDQIEECYLAANKKRIFGENNELKRALRGKNGVNRDGSGSHQEGISDTHAPKQSTTDAKEYARLGYKWNPTARRFEKKLPTGNVLVKDPKSKKTFVVKA